jgi:hypothetical protein
MWKYLYKEFSPFPYLLFVSMYLSFCHVPRPPRSYMSIDLASVLNLLVRSLSTSSTNLHYSSSLIFYSSSIQKSLRKYTSRLKSLNLTPFAAPPSQSTCRMTFHAFVSWAFCSFGMVLVYVPFAWSMRVSFTLS